MRKVGEDVTEILEYRPGRFEVIRHVRPAYSCRTCEAMAQAPMPSLPIPRGQAGPGLLAHMLIGKYCDHVPLYRQSQIYARDGVELDRALLADWAGRAAWLIDPLVEAIARHVKAGETIHVDDTPIPVLAPGRGKTKEGRLWVYLRDERPHEGNAPPAALYRYTPDRKGEHPQSELTGFKSFLHADGYSGFNALYHSRDGEPPPTVEVACWAHVRRKFYDIYEKTKAPLAAEALERIGILFEIERSAKGKAPAERRALRREHALPQLKSLARWFGGLLTKLSGKSDMAGAIRYARSRWVALTRYADDGRLEISNNAAERAIRPISIGRNYAQVWIMRSCRVSCAESSVDRPARSALSRSSCT
jgi:transposase